MSLCLSLCLSRLFSSFRRLEEKNIYTYIHTNFKEFNGEEEDQQQQQQQQQQLQEV